MPLPLRSSPSCPWRRLGAACLLAAWGLCAWPAAAGTPPAADLWHGTVTWVTDGDTLWIRPTGGGRPRKLRLQGMDAPEICQSGGPAARDALAALTLHRPATVRTHWRDGWGRPLAVLWVDGQDVAARMVASGWAWSPRWRRRAGPYALEEAAARAAGLGIFASTATPEPPSHFRKRHGPCPRPPARAMRHPNGE
ncbi:thermonuclease family protein [Comamonadaceae bacterium OH2545_COT-014]|nr:thermonuclease family protein [Comamonadaceae bacterium OH2545_COT-014]